VNFRDLRGFYFALSVQRRGPEFTLQRALGEDKLKLELRTVEGPPSRPVILAMVVGKRSIRFSPNKKRPDLRPGVLKNN
jgi:hypothetical protein